MRIYFIYWFHLLFLFVASTRNKTPTKELVMVNGRDNSFCVNRGGQFLQSIGLGQPDTKTPHNTKKYCFNCIALPQRSTPNIAVDVFFLKIGNIGKYNIFKRYLPIVRACSLNETTVLYAKFLFYICTKSPLRKKKPSKESRKRKAMVPNLFRLPIHH